MKPPPPVDAVSSEDPLLLLISAFESGRLIAFLKGDGLTGSAVQELLKPESVAKLRTVLTKRSFSGPEDHDPGQESPRGRFQPEEGKVLVFKAREAFKP